MINNLPQTATFIDIFNKINELILKVNSLDEFQGDLTVLNTLNKSNLVSAINEKSPSFITSFIIEE